MTLYDSGTVNEMPSAAPVLPEQCDSYPASACKARGEVALMRAVLEDAIDCFQKQSVAGRRLAREAEEWFFTDDYCWTFSFVNICAVLGLDPECIRLGLKRWLQHHPANPQRLHEGPGSTRRRRLNILQKPLKLRPHP